jgi:NADH-quinone oxidoreductase subunit A
MPQNYVPIFLFVAVIGILIPAALLASKIVRARNPDPTKLASEPGSTPSGNAREQRTGRLYIFATTFVLFEAEAIFLFPWAVRFKSLGRFGLIEMLISLVVLVIGYIWIWRKGVLKWF